MAAVSLPSGPVTALHPETEMVEVWRVGAMGFGGCGGWGRERESRLWGYSQNN